MSRTIKRNHNLRREIAEFVLNCSMDELMAVLTNLEGDSRIPEFFSCEHCKKLFGDCNEGCESRILKYEEMRDDG